MKQQYFLSKMDTNPQYNVHISSVCHVQILSYKSSVTQQQFLTQALTKTLSALTNHCDALNRA